VVVLDTDMPVPHLSRGGAVVAAGTVLALLSGCGSASTSLSARQQDVRSSASNIKLTDCASECSGEIDGAKYAIKLPQKWNGTLLLYSHGYRFAAPAPPSFDPVDTKAQVSSTDSDGTGSDPLSASLLAAGYALAGSSYKSNGWAAADGVKAGVDLHDKFVKLVGTPKRTYVWGDSLGGLVTELLAETHPDWVDGAAPMCGVLAGPNYNFDAALDVAFAVKTLVDPQLKLTGYTDQQDASTNWQHASEAVQKAAADVAGGGTAKVMFIGSLVDAPTATTTYDGHDLPSQVKARVEALLTALAFGTSGRYELEQRVGGNPSTNSDADYSTRIDAAEAGLISTVGGNLDALQKQLAAAPRVSADATARSAFEQLGDPTGKLTVPTVTMHTEQDPLVLVQNETVFAGRARAEQRSGQLVQLYIKPPATYSETTKAPYGAGHCRFSDGQRLGLINVLDGWVRRSIYPSPTGSAALIGEGIDPSYVPGQWPVAESS
jgi:pimeloyl-ACP methyl ester carboxylesterase